LLILPLWARGGLRTSGLGLQTSVRGFRLPDPGGRFASDPVAVLSIRAAGATARLVARWPLFGSA
jgi:hypothetical protein